MKIFENISLKEKTTFGMGGITKYWLDFEDENDIYSFFELIKEKKLPYLILGEGSNTIFTKDIFDGVILHPKNGKILINVENQIFEFELPVSVDSYYENYDISPNLDLLYTVDEFIQKKSKIQISVDAGVNWDSFVYFCIIHGIGGLESLSGIPGKVGAAPVQNIGAYGEEVKNYIENVTFFSLYERKPIKNIFSQKDCQFSYRNSIFKKNLLNYFIIKVDFIFDLSYIPIPKYKEIIKLYENSLKFLKSFVLPEVYNNVSFDLLTNIKRLLLLRRIIYETRRKKGMILEKNNELHNTAGSFFMNPIISVEEWETIKDKIVKNFKCSESEIPFFIDKGSIKIPAAWLIEKSGFYKGYRYHNLGISPKHSLAIINYNSHSDELYRFVKEIQESVYYNTGVRLQPEVVII